MKSNINLSIEIEHEDNLGLDSDGIASEVARFLADRLGVKGGRIGSIQSGRRTVAGGVTVTLQSAAITSQLKIREA